MRFRIDAKELSQVLSAVAAKGRIQYDCVLEAVQGAVIVRHSDGLSYSEITIPAEVLEEGKVSVITPMLLKFLKTVGQSKVEIFLHDRLSRLVVQVENGTYFLPLGVDQDEDDAFRAQVIALMNEAKPVVTFKSPSVWRDSSAVKQFRGQWDFNFIWVVPIFRQIDWALSKPVAAVVATDQYVLAAVLLTENSVECYAESAMTLFVPPEWTALQVTSFALAEKEEEAEREEKEAKHYIYAVSDSGFVVAPTTQSNSVTYCNAVNRLLTEPGVQIRFDRQTWQNIKKATQTYAKSAQKGSIGGIVRWDIRPDGKHFIWTTEEQGFLFTAEKASVEGSLPGTATFNVRLLDKAIQFIPTPSVIEVFQNDDLPTLRLRDEFNYRVCVVQGMTAGSDYESFYATQGLVSGSMTPISAKGG
jgi:hypothetical protein